MKNILSTYTYLYLHILEFSLIYTIINYVFFFNKLDTYRNTSKTEDFCT